MVIMSITIVVIIDLDYWGREEEKYEEEDSSSILHHRCYSDGNLNENEALTISTQ